ncbi:kinase [Thraustotheca clavata]|uniref:Kinase n=1 Tax=Thraustotheca clavata TaxID=74557 RepID=A0A1V9YYY9_9STRA|nr:kinase [Thraustotheca clavata]
MDLMVSVREARNLRNTQLFGTMDPYCTVKVSGHKVKTKVHHKGGTNPHFDGTFQLSRVNGDDTFQLEVKNHSIVRKTHIGILRIPLMQAVQESAGVERPFQLYTNRIPPMRAGEVIVKLELRASSSLMPQPPINGTHVLNPRVNHSGYQQPNHMPERFVTSEPQLRVQERSNSDHQLYNTAPGHANYPLRITSPPEPNPPHPTLQPPSSTYHYSKNPSNETPSTTILIRQHPEKLKTIPNPVDGGRLVHMGSGDDTASQFPHIGIPNELPSNAARPVTTSPDEIDWTGHERLMEYRHLYIYPSNVKIIRSLQSDYMKTELAHYGGQLAMVKSLKFQDEKDALVKEIISLSKVDCPKILKFMGFYISPTAGLCCVTENLAGNPPDLRALLNRPNHGLTWHDKLRMAKDVAEALVYMHRQRPIMIHRNIKAASVILGRRREAVLSGFGCCRDRSYDQTMTSGVGEVQWSAPEMLMDGDYAEKVDVYSFGVLLVEMDTHKIPFEEESNRFSRGDFIGMLVTGTLRHRPSSNCPPQIRQIIKMCIQQDPALRSNMLEVLNLLMSVTL